MNIKERRICRLCLKVAENEFVIDDTVKQILEILLLKVNLDITRDPIICQDCMEVAKKCLRFKYTCIDAEQVILSHVTDKIEAKLNIKIIYEQCNPIRTVFHENLKICRFCITGFESNNFIVSQDRLRIESMLEILSQFMTEVDFSTLEIPLICVNCRENLEGYFKFVLNCLESEAKLKACCKEKATYSMGQVKLDNVRQFISTDILERSDKCSQTCKIEKNHSECVYPETYIESIKQEELDTKDEEMTLDLQTSISVVRGVSEIKMHKCLLCPYESKIRSNLNRHMLVHKDVSDVKKCLLCPYETKSRKYLNRHQLVHKVVSLECSLCTYKATHEVYLKRHMLVHKGLSEVKVHKCSLCSFQSKYKCSLRDHILVHQNVSEIKMYKCSFCAYETRKKNNLTVHALVHSDVSEIKMYKCSLCPYEAKRKGNLKGHMLVHKDVSKIEMHKCSLCAYEAKKKSRLTVHMLVHKDVSKIKMQKCTLCAFESKYKYSLKKHMLVHKDV